MPPSDVDEMNLLRILWNLLLMQIPEDPELFYCVQMYHETKKLDETIT